MFAACRRLFQPALDTLKHQDDLQRHGNVDRIRASRGRSQLRSHMPPCGLLACRRW
jgi:hypothetical protein